VLVSENARVEQMDDEPHVAARLPVLGVLRMCYRYLVATRVQTAMAADADVHIGGQLGVLTGSRIQLADENFR
jgi:hypothetical protein